MGKIPAKVPPFDYLGGKNFTEKLKEVTGSTNYNILADYFGIPKSTLLTWHTHNRTGFELIVREHLATGASVRYMALGEGEPFDQQSEPAAALATFKLIDGSLIESKQRTIDLSTLEDFGLEPSYTLVVEDDAGIYYLNKESNNPSSGSYLIDIDGQLSINFIQRLPGQKLSINIGDSCIEAKVDDIKVLGRVAMEMKKK
ncbi:helix-turn-helix domain-containing protein [Vibrio sp. Of7-15]|uniref:helix-turn-helix domain-containing protein n=1 Tax=Vibrio sp. Of7-15 TaxID=2724879 RepID=UPI001EF1FBE5|nr:helix-turn-helix domain-containing protein [Vibrio sp. Of7-15]MCG7499344.1 helix-turn-helix domain-containing protein [Vibrio sp. Of7-15]